MTPTKNLHLSHLEDLAFDGYDGCCNIIRLLTRITRGANSHLNISQKWDGAPAIVAGIDPSDKKFFVGTKSVFNKTKPVLFKSIVELDDGMEDCDLKFKLALCFNELQGVITRGVFQGDVIFTPKETFSMSFDGLQYDAFQMNTLVYATAGAYIPRSVELGVVFHTSYEGDTIATMEASYYPIDLSRFKKKPSLWLHDPTVDQTDLFKSFPRSSTLSAVVVLMSSLLQELTPDFLNVLPGRKNLLTLCVNSMIRDGENAFEKLSKDTHHEFLKRWIFTYFQKEIAKKSSAAGKATWKEHLNNALTFVTDHAENLTTLFEFQAEVVVAKLVLINKLERLNSLETFFRKKDGTFKRTGSEGYVISNKSSDLVVKLVDRVEFSYGNFSDELIKGWQNARTN